MSAWMAAATSYSNHDYPLIPFYIFYSMFGYQRVGDLCWAAGDMRARGFLLGGTSGRTTLNGEGLQHQDGHSLVLHNVVPNCMTYDPAFSYEVAVIIQDGMRRMYEENQNIHYYITLLNENYHHPAMPKGAEEGIIKGIYPLESTNVSGKAKTKTPRVQLLGSGAILNEVRAAAELLRDDYKVGSDVWSVTSFGELARDGNHVTRWNRLHPDEKPKTSWVYDSLAKSQGPVIASTDYIRLQAEQIRSFVPAPYHVLGTDGFGRSDTREQLRAFFEVDRYHVVVAALSALAEQEEADREQVLDAMRRYNIDRNKPNPAFS